MNVLLLYAILGNETVVTLWKSNVSVNNINLTKHFVEMAKSTCDSCQIRLNLLFCFKTVSWSQKLPSTQRAVSSIEFAMMQGRGDFMDKFTMHILHILGLQCNAYLKRQFISKCHSNIWMRLNELQYSCKTNSFKYDGVTLHHT